MPEYHRRLELEEPIRQNVIEERADIWRTYLLAPLSKSVFFSFGYIFARMRKVQSERARTSTLFLSTSTLRKTTFLFAPLSSANFGAICLHGPHHVA